MGLTRQRIWELIDGLDPKDRWGGNISAGLLVLIFFNVVAVILETVESYRVAWSTQFMAFEIFSVAVFSVEYLLRLWSCTTQPAFQGALRGRIRYALTPMALIDLLAILPFYLPLLVAGLDTRMLRALRLMRLFRLLKIGRYAETIRVMGRVIASRKEELLISAFTLLIALLVASSLMYYIERDAQPDAYGSIPDAMWWAVITLTTVGYGDVHPITPLGKAVATGIAIVGVGLFGLPAAIIASGFLDEIQQRLRAEDAARRDARHEALVRAAEQGVCPSCGQSVATHAAGPTPPAPSDPS